MGAGVVDRNARLIVEEIDIEPSENVTEDPNVAAGTDFVTKEGVNGRARVTYSVISVDGKEVSRTEVSRTVLEEPVSADVTKGTGKPEVISSELSAVAKGVGDPEGNRAYAKVFIAQSSQNSTIEIEFDFYLVTHCYFKRQSNCIF